jgi:hypothetical protein
MSFLYFLPGKQLSQIRGPKELRTALSDVGLAYLGIRELTEVTVSTVDRSGDGVVMRGVIIARKINGAEPAVSTYATGQRWLNCGRYQIGCNPDSPPSPPDLVRANVSQGYLIKDSRGRQWSVPVIASPIPENVTLPADFMFNLETGVPYTVPKPEYQPLVDLAAKLEKKWYGSAEIPATELATAAIKIIGVNYHVGSAEANLLTSIGWPIVDSKTAQLITLFCLDSPKIREANTAEPAEKN